MGEIETKDRTLRRFRFVTAWATEASFNELIRTSSRNNEEWPTTISHLTGRIIEWISSVFGNINLRKNSLMRRLCGIDGANRDGTNQFLNHLQESLWKSYEKTLLQEELL